MSFIIDSYRFGGAGTFDDSDLKAYWKFDEASPISNSSQAAASLGSGATLTATGATRNVGGGIFGDAGDLDGTDDEYIADNAAGDYTFMHSNSALFSVNFWCQLHSRAARAFLGGTKGSGSTTGVWIYFDDTNNTIEFATGDPNESILAGTSNNFYPNNSDWHMITVTYNQTPATGNLNIYIDGGNKETFNKAGDNGTTGDPFQTWTIGERPENNDMDMDGLMDEYSIWNRILSDAEITELYNSGSGLEIY